MNKDRLYRARESYGNQLPQEERQEIIFDWDDDYHFAIALKKGDSRAIVAAKLLDAYHDLIDFDKRIKQREDT